MSFVDLHGKRAQHAKNEPAANQFLNISIKNYNFLTSIWNYFQDIFLGHDVTKSIWDKNTLPMIRETVAWELNQLIRQIKGHI